MGLAQVGQVLAVERITRAGAPVLNIKLDFSGVVATADGYSTGGDDAPPLAGDYAAIAPNARSGGGSVVGYADPVNVGAAQPGEKRIYSRDADGNVTAVIHLFNNGGVIIETLEAAGVVTIRTPDSTIRVDSSGVDINGVEIATNGDTTFPGACIVGGVDMNGHQHMGSPTAGTGAVSNTGVPL